MQSLLIKDTTRAQREEIVRRALAACGGSCEGCNGCGNSGGVVDGGLAFGKDGCHYDIGSSRNRCLVE